MQLLTNGGKVSTRNGKNIKRELLLIYAVIRNQIRLETATSHNPHFHPTLLHTKPNNAPNAKRVAQAESINGIPNRLPTKPATIEPISPLITART